jgi:hypothetical protein
VSEADADGRVVGEYRSACLGAGAVGGDRNAACLEAGVWRSWRVVRRDADTFIGVRRARAVVANLRACRAISADGVGIDIGRAAQITEHAVKTVAAPCGRVEEVADLPANGHREAVVDAG